MLSLIFKFPLYFALSFIVLSIPLNNKTLFYHIDHAIGPVTTQVHREIRKVIIESYDVGKEFTKKVFLPNAPKIERSGERTDAIHQKNSGISIEQVQEYTPEDRILLQSLLESSDIKEGKRE